MHGPRRNRIDEGTMTEDAFMCLYSRRRRCRSFKFTPFSAERLLPTYCRADLAIVSEKQCVGLCPDRDVGNLEMSDDVVAGEGGKLRPETDIGAFRARRKAWG